MSLEWEIGGPWFMRTTCRTYRISKGLVKGAPWYLVHLGKQIIGQRQSSWEAAMEIAESHHATESELQPD